MIVACGETAAWQRLHKSDDDPSPFHSFNLYHRRRRRHHRNHCHEETKDDGANPKSSFQSPQLLLNFSEQFLRALNFVGSVSTSSFLGNWKTMSLMITNPQYFCSSYTYKKCHHENFTLFLICWVGIGCTWVKFMADEVFDNLIVQSPDTATDRAHQWDCQRGELIAFSSPF